LAALILGLFLFSGLHLLRETGLREPLRRRLGIPRYMLLFCAGILLAVILIVHGKSTSPFVQLWVPPYNWRSITNMAMLTACIFVAAGNLPHSYLKESLTHPMLLGIIVWGVAHLLSNGDLASVLLFGGLSLWAAVKIATLQWGARHTAPPAVSTGATRKPSLYWDATAVISGTIVYGAFLVFHGPLFGFALIPAA
jgi:uncharacterized membrane protein